MLQVQRLTKKFGDFVAVNDVSFELSESASLGIVGQNGAGKSTVSNLILGELKPTSGEIRFYGERISGLDAPRVAQKGISKTFQHTNIFLHLSVFENVKLGTLAKNKSYGIRDTLIRHEPPDTTRDTIDILHTLELEDVSSKPAIDLGLGDKRRLEVAISLATKPKLLIMDEPTAGISSQDLDDMIGILRGITKRVTVMLIEHDMEVLTALVGRVILMHNGSVIADGSTEEIMNSKAMRELYLGR